MDTQAILAAIDSEISKLQQARAMLANAKPTPLLIAAKKSVGRPKGSKSAVTVAPVVKRVMSEEGKAKIAAAQKKRWAAAKKAAKK